jgi:hypothetical protein
MAGLAHGAQRFHHLVKGQVLMGIGLQDHLTDAGEHLLERWVPA